MQRHKQSAFTLVELIVVITILAILGTIAFISLQGYSATSRDSVRIADVGSMSTALEIFQVNSGKYPVPDNGGSFTYLGDPLWTQGNFGENVVKNLSRNFSKAPRDPLSDKEYIYSRAGNGNEFQILNLLEGYITLNTISQTNAAESVRTPKVGGTYNGLYIKTKNYLIPLPSILTSLDYNKGDSSEISGTGILSQVITGGTNVPKYGNTKSGTGGIIGLQLSVADIVTSESTATEKAAAMQKIQDAYSGSSLKNSGIYEYILSVSGEDNLADLLETVVLNNAATVVSTGPTDSEAPTGGSFSMSGTTSSTSINLSITCPEEDGVDMYISGTGLSTGGNEWVVCEATKSIVLTSGDGTKNITMKFRDSGGNVADEITNSIILASYDAKGTIGGIDVYYAKIPSGTDLGARVAAKACYEIGKKLASIENCNYSSSGTNGNIYTVEHSSYKIRTRYTSDRSCNGYSGADRSAITITQGNLPSDRTMCGMHAGSYLNHSTLIADTPFGTPLCCTGWGNSGHSSCWSSKTIITQDVYIECVD